MHHLLRNKTLSTFLLAAGMLSSFLARAQREINRPEHDDQLYYFGITLGYNSSWLAASKHPKFIGNDSIYAAEPGASGGITLGLLATARMTDHFQFRINPQLVIGGAKYINYSLKNPAPGEAEEQKKILPSTLVSLPIQIKFNSDRIDNFRMYVLGGIRFDKDMSSNSSARNAEDLLKLKGNDFALEAGLGFSFYLRFVTISPELKYTYGINNIHSRDPNLKYSWVFDKIESRMFSFSLHFE